MSEQATQSAAQLFRERSGQVWAELQASTDVQLGPIGLRAMRELSLSEGSRVIDVGTGCGQTLVQLASMVGAGGRALGVDISEPMLDVARQRIRDLPQAEVILADAALFGFEPQSFDAVFSRFGVMFFEEPVAAFANLRKALRPGGELAFVCWQAMELNPWSWEALQAVLRAAPGTPIPDVLLPDRPGPFFFADPAKIRHILTNAGFGDLELTAVTEGMHVGGTRTLEEVVAYLQRLGPAARMLESVDESLRGAVEAELTRAFAPYVTDRGVYADGAVWIVTAQAA